MNAKMKYVTFTGYAGEQIIIFPKKIQHSDFAKSVKELSFGTMRPIAGGFIVNGECVGRSESLNMDSRGKLDTDLILNLLDMNPDEHGYVLDESNVTDLKANRELSKNQAKRLRKKRRAK